MLTSATSMLTYADVCLLTYAAGFALGAADGRSRTSMLTYADVC
jgi:hypothetical protein